MASLVKEKVFEKKHTKLKAFIKYAIRYGIYLAVIYGALILFAYNKRVDNPFDYAKFYWLMFLAVAVLGTIVNAVKEKDVNVTVMSRTVDITVGGENTVYPVSKFVGPFFNTSKKKNQCFELVFADDENDPDSTHFIVLPGLKTREFMDICDAIMIAKHELAGDIKYEAFEGDTYEKNRKDGYDMKSVFLPVLVFGIPVGSASLLLCSYIFKRSIWDYAFPMTIVFIFYIFILVNFIHYLIDYGPKAKALKTLNFKDSGIEINGVLYSYKDIETVTMTQPYLMEFSAFHRVLAIKLYDAKKPLRFSLGNRIEKEETEEELGKGCTCIYPALYERIKTDKALGRKFKL